MAARRVLVSLEPIEHFLALLDAVVAAQVDHQEDQVGRTDQVLDVRVHEILGDRRRVDQLHGHVLEGHHRRGRRLRGERVGGHLGRRPREAANQLALAGVGTAQEDCRAGPLPGDAKTAAALLAAALLGDQVLLELGDLGLQIGLEVVGPLVLGDLLEHDLQTGQFFLARRGPAVFLLGLQVLLGEIGWHACLFYRSPAAVVGGKLRAGFRQAHGLHGTVGGGAGKSWK